MHRFPEIWLHQLYKSQHHLQQPLLSLNNTHIKVVKTGEYNTDNGPDFRNALLEIDGILQQGDVEIHYCLQDWYSHAHQNDRRYQNVILHLLWQSSINAEKPILQQFEHVILSENLTIKANDWLAIMETFESIKRPYTVSQLPNLLTIANFANQRLERKALSFGNLRETCGIDNAVWLLIAEALGFSKNRQPMYQLAHYFLNQPNVFSNLKIAHSPLLLWQFCLHISGLSEDLNSKLSNPKLIAKYQQQIQFWNDNGIFPTLSVDDWYFARLRPQNAPVLRIAAFASLYCAFYKINLFSHILEAAYSRPAFDTLLKKLRALFLLPLPSCIQQFCLEETTFKSVTKHIMGENRFRQIVVNVILPALWDWANATKNYGFKLYIESIFEALPSSEILPYLDNYIDELSKLNSVKLPKSAFWQQGLLEWMAVEQMKNA